MGVRESCWQGVESTQKFYPSKVMEDEGYDNFGSFADTYDRDPPE